MDGRPAGKADRAKALDPTPPPTAPWERIGTQAATMTCLLTDHLGTPILASSTAGTLVWSAGFEPYGRDYADARGANLHLRLPGQLDDPLWHDSDFETPLYYNVHRWYEPQSGRYTQPDPFGHEEGDWTLYAYAVSNPLFNIDPEGLVALAPGQKCKGFDKALRKLQTLKQNCECLAYFRDVLGADLPGMLDGALPQVRIRTGPGSASTPCSRDPGAIWIDPEFCRLGNRGHLPHIILHELAHFADCDRQRFPPGGGVEEGAEAERKCLGDSIDSRGR